MYNSVQYINTKLMLFQHLLLTAVYNFPFHLSAEITALHLWMFSLHCKHLPVQWDVSRAHTSSTLHLPWSVSSRTMRCRMTSRADPWTLPRPWESLGQGERTSAPPELPWCSAATPSRSCPRRRWGGGRSDWRGPSPWSIRCGRRPRTECWPRPSRITWRGRCRSPLWELPTGRCETRDSEVCFESKVSCT